MKAQDIDDAVGGLSDELLEETQRARAAGEERRRKRLRQRLIAAAACVCVAAGAAAAVPLFGRHLPATDPTASGVSDTPEPSAAPTSPTPPQVIEGVSDTPEPSAAATSPTPPQVIEGEAKALAEASYPTMPQYDEDETYEQRRKRIDAAEAQAAMLQGQGAGMQKVYQQLLSRLLIPDDGKADDRACSPLNIYLTLSMLAECTAGNTQKQILSLLGVRDTAALRTKADALWNANYLDDGLTMSRLAASLWLSDAADYRQETVDTLARRYHVSSFSGKVGTPGYDAAIHDWIGRQTGGLLDEQARQFKTNVNTLMVLLGTIWFRAEWADRFPPSLTKPAAFHAPDGDTTVQMMELSRSIGEAYVGDRMSAVYLPFSSDTPFGMWVVLPDEGVGTAELIDGGELLSLLTKQRKEKIGRYRLTVQLPRFDVTGDTDLIPVLQRLGVTDVFAGGKADLSALLTDDTAYVSDARHVCRVTVDEKGCEAAAFTVATAGNAMPPKADPLTLRFDRPFMFLVTGPGDTLLFAGVVAHP